MRAGQVRSIPLETSILTAAAALYRTRKERADCEAKNVKSVYYGESGKSGIYRVQKGHKNDIKRRNKKML